MPYRVGQSTGHLLGLVAFLLPALLLALERRRFVLAGVALAALPLSGQLHLTLGAIPLALGYAWARLPRADWWKAGAGAAAAVLAGIAVERRAVAGSIGTGRSFAQVERYSAELADLVTRGVGGGIEELVFVGWLTPLVALAGLWRLASRPQRGLAVAARRGSARPVPPGAGRQPSRVRDALAPRPGARCDPGPRAPDADRLPRDRRSRGVRSSRRSRGSCRINTSSLSPLAAVVAVVVLAVDLRVPVFGAVAADAPSSAYAAIRGEGRLLELPVFRPDVHYGSAYLGYARQSPRERPQGYSTLAPPAADRLARQLRGLSCGRGTIPPDLGVRFVTVHRGLYAQSGFFARDCAERAESRLREEGWRLLARDGPIAAFSR